MIKLVKIRNICKIKKVFIMIFLFSFIFLGLNPVTPGNMLQTEKIGENLLISPLTAEVHDPIFIVGNTELIAFCADNGKDGLSWATAYVIKDYEIDAEASGCAIEISDTTLFLIIQNCTVTNSEADNDAGIYLNNCTNVKITGCNSSFNPDYGIHLYDSHDCIISGNNLSNNDYGIRLAACSDNVISGNNASYNTERGILLDNGCYNNTISGNDVSKITNFGIELNTNCDNNTISGNNASNNVYGIYIEDSDNNIISENYASHNDYGIDLELECYNNIISGNNASDNSASGIQLKENCDNNTILENFALDNYDGIYINDQCDNNTILGNYVSYNDYGIELYVNCDNNIITGNNMSYNDEDGIFLYSFCENNTISNNFASHNIDNGIELYENCDNNIITGNNMSDNNYGIYLYINCDNNTLSGNDVSYNFRGLYFEENIEDNTIWMNYISNNSNYQGESDISSNWDNGTLGNYWGDFREKYPDATSSNGIWWDWEYEVDPGYNDTRPLVHPGFPEISSSANIDYMIGDEGNEISWTISDSTILDPTYWIYLDGVEIQTGSWNSGSIFSINVDGYSVGTYNYVLKCNDGTAWGWSEGQIVVNVNEVPKPVLITTSQTISTENITVEWSEVVGVDSYNVYVNGTLINSTDTLEQNIWLNESGTYIITVTATYGAEESEHSDTITIIVLLDDSKNNLFWYLFAGGWLLVAVFIGIAFVKVKMKK